MKKISFPSFLKANVFLLCASALFITITSYSCRKVENDDISEYATLSDEEKIKPSNIVQWLEEFPAPLNSKTSSGLDTQNKGFGKLPFRLNWKRAEQRIINGAHVVRVPISKDACIVFVKDQTNGPLDAFIFKLEKNAKNNSPYSGRILQFSFQDLKWSGTLFKEGKGVESSVTSQIEKLTLEKLEPHARSAPHIQRVPTMT